MTNIIEIDIGRTSPAWVAELSKNDDGAPHASLANTLIVMGCDPVLKGMVRWDDFAYRNMISRAPPALHLEAGPAEGPYPRPITDEDVTAIQSYVQRVRGMRINQQTAQQAVEAIAQINKFHPVREYLNGLVWDGVERLDKWVSIAFGTPQDAYHAAVGRKWLCGAERRVRVPGCKFDSVPVLEGPQGIGKTASLAALGGSEWYSDDMPKNLSDRDAAMALHGVWIMEMSELASIVRTNNEDVKSFITRCSDHYRPVYGKLFIDRLRQSILTATTNETDWLRDTTGNRRYWPITCTRAEAMWIAENRDQLWAEAVMMEPDEPLWLDLESLRATATEYQNDRLVEDAWQDRVEAYCSTRSQVKAADILQHGMGLSIDKQDRRAMIRIADILRCMGWTRRKVRSIENPSKIRWFWVSEKT